MKEKVGFLIRHREARILREAVAHCANYGTPTIRARALESLRRYSHNIRQYCKHVDVSSHQGGTCVDCGTIVGIKKDAND